MDSQSDSSSPLVASGRVRKKVIRFDFTISVLLFIMQLCFIGVYLIIEASGVAGCIRTRSPIDKSKLQVMESIQATSVQQPATTVRTRTPPGDYTRSGIESADIKNLTEELYNLETNNVWDQLKINYQGKTTSSEISDAAPEPLFTRVPNDVMRLETFRRFEALLNNYIADVRVNEEHSKMDKNEKNAFLDALMRTEVMERTERFLKDKGLIMGNSLRRELDIIWFTPYPRSRGRISSSGFEHVFLGEIKEGKVSGFHNWIFFMKEEAEEDLNYKGYIRSLDLGKEGQIVKVRYDWMNRPKAFGTMFIGTSPELEMALYTICFYARRNTACNLQMNNQQFRLKVYGQNYHGKTVIGSAYPELY